MDKKQGFTLIELLVVIAIIGVLASIVITNLNASRIKSRINAALQSLTSAKTAAYACLQESGEINPDPVAGGEICNPLTDPSQLWPALPPLWSYDTNTDTSNPAQGTFTFEAIGDSVRITCVETGCSVANI